MGKKGTKRKTRWRVLPIGEDGGSASGNEEEGDCENGAGATGSYARATQHRPIRRPNNRPGNQTGYYNKQHHHSSPRPYNNHDNHQPLVTTEKHIFNEEEYTKITTPRQDVLFKKGYLGRKRPTVTAESSEQQTTSADVANGNAAHYDPSSGHNEGLDNDPNEMLEEHPQFMYTNGFVDQSSGVYYINGSRYEIYDPYSGQVTFVVGPHYGPNGGPPVLAAVPCQPVPLQPLEWFNPPGFLPYVTAPGPAGVPRDRRKRYSTDSQNCSPQSSESTGPPGSPQESDEVALTGGPEGAMYNPHQPPPPQYVYPGYMFGAPMYNMNGVTVQSTPNAAPSSDVGGKRRKKKRRRRRRRNGVEDGSEESSSEDKDHEEEPMSVTSQESSLESDSKLSSLGENPRPCASEAVAAAVTKSNAHTQTVVEREEDAVEPDQQPSPASSNDAATDTVDFTAYKPHTNGFGEEVYTTAVEKPTPAVNGGSLSGNTVVNGDRLVNGHEFKSKGDRKTEKKGKKVNSLTNGIVEKPREVPVKQVDESDDFVFQDNSFLYTQEFINGNVKVELDEESEWITVKGHKGSQNKRSDSARFNEEKKLPPELTNGHAKFSRDNRLNGVSGKDKVPYKNNADKFAKTEKSYQNGKVEEKCTYAKVKQTESGNKEKIQANGKAKLVNGSSKMDGNEREDTPRGREAADSDDAARKVAVERPGQSPESPRDAPRKSVQEVEEVAPSKPTRKERRSQKNGSPPKTPEVVLTATAKPFEMPSVSLRPEAFAKKSDVGPKLEKLSREDTLLAALTVAPKDERAQPEVPNLPAVLAPKETTPGKDGRKPGDSSKKMNGNAEKKKKTQQSPDPSKVSSLRDLSSKSIEKEEAQILAVKQVRSEQTVPPQVVKSAKDTSKEFIEQESRPSESPKTVKPAEVDVKPAEPRAESGVEKTQEADSDSEAPPPVPPPRRRKWHPSSKRLSSERAPTPGKGESTDESSSSSSQESEESVIECLSSGFNSPKAKVSSGFSSDDEDIIYQGSSEEQDPKALGRISESQEESSSSNGKPVKPDRGPRKVATSPEKQVSKETPKTPVPQISVQTVTTQDPDENTCGMRKSEEHLKNVQKIAQEIVDSIIQEALRETVRLKYQKDNDPVKLGITDAVTRWLRSQSPDVLSLPRNEDSDSDITEDLEADDKEKTANGSKNLKSNPLPAPSVENIDSQLNVKDLIGGKDGTGRRVANTISEKKHLKDSRNDTPDLEDDAISNSSVSCGEWDLWDCQHKIPHNYDEILNKPQQKHTKNTNETNIISPIKKHPHSPPHKCLNSSHSLVPERSPVHVSYDPLANDTFSPIESTILSEVLEPSSQAHDHCSSICDPTLSVAKYYVLGPQPGSSLSPVEDLDCTDSDASSATGRPDVGVYHVSLAEELARLEQPLPASWAVEPLRVPERPGRCGGCRCQIREGGATADSGVESGDEAVVARKRESMSVFKRKLVGRLKGEGAPFPCGGICCILQ